MTDWMSIKKDTLVRANYERIVRQYTEIRLKLAERDPAPALPRLSGRGSIDPTVEKLL
jgi:hypothetical protein